jgi:NADH-quinone oxidoreductase subunit A
MESSVLENYLPILIFIIIGGLLGAVALMIGRLLGPKRPGPAKNSPYECGFPAFDDARLPFDVRFYLVAILFIIFDLETAFLVPWAVVFRQLGWFGLSVMGIFLGLLIIGFIYEWKKGALEWE